MSGVLMKCSLVYMLRSFMILHYTNISHILVIVPMMLSKQVYLVQLLGIDLTPQSFFDVVKNI